MVILYKPGRIVGQGVNNTARALVSTCLKVLCALCRNGLALFHTLSRGVLAGKIALHVHLAHIIHGGCHGSLNARIKCCRIHAHTSKSAYSDYADTLGVNIILNGQEINRCQEILGVDIGRCHTAGLAATLTGKRGVKGNSQESALGHVLCVQTA